MTAAVTPGQGSATPAERGAAHHPERPGAPVEQVRASVEAFAPATERERRSRTRFLAELARHAAPFDRDGDAVHVTGSGIVLGERADGERVTVLHLHRRAQRWMQPGGHVDAGEAPWEAALRETREETGLPVAHPPSGPFLLHLDVHPAGPHVHLDLRYLLHSEVVEPAPPPGESQHVRWLSLPEALALADDALVDGLRRLSRVELRP